MSIPRLELMGAVTGAQIATFVASEIQLPVSKIYLWTDAKCVLHWLRSPKPLKTFVQNRIRKLKERQEIEYRYVPTTCNPADIISRGLELDELTDTRMWRKGPQFLSVNPDLWPETVLPPSSNEPEISHEFARGQTVMINNPAPRQGVDQVIDPSQYSSWGKLLRVTVYILRFCRILKIPKGHSIPKQDWEVAERHWISAAQAAGCADWVKQKPLEAKNLGTYTDDQGIIRCKGRLELSNLDDAAKFPILLPKDHAVTKLILKSCHEKTGHAHVRLTLGKVRERYWIPQGRPAVHKVIRDCNLCRKAQGGPFRLPSSPPLPDFRVNEAKPFQKLGLDYFGPLLIRSFAASDEPAKVWVCLFTCCVTRAVHLELVPDLTAEQFLLCFRRFTAVHRAPDLIISDNAKQFKTASKVLKQAFDEAKLAEDGYSLDWRFIPESAPWMGGFYERLVGAVKSALKKTLGIRRLTLFQMQTLLTEIASIVNSRPLLPMENEPGGTGLTPSHFLSAQGSSGLPQIDTQSNTEDSPADTGSRLLESWKKGQRILNEYWTCWRTEYLASLRERAAVNFHERNTSLAPPKVGGVVLIKDDGPRCSWKLGIIQELNLSRDGAHRSARVRVGRNKYMTRPLKLLYPLELEASEPQNSTEGPSGAPDTNPPSAPPPSRNPPGTAPPDGAPCRSARKAAHNAHGQIQAGLMSFDSDSE